MTIIKKVDGHRVRVGGTQQTGWRPDGAMAPLPPPVREVDLDFEIQFDGSGYLLCYASPAGELYGDTWHETLDDAMEQAATRFGVSPDQWQSA